MQNRSTRDVLSLGITATGWILTIVFVAAPAFKTFDPKGDSLAGQFLCWLIAGWLTGMNNGTFFGVQIHYWMILGCSYLCAFALSHSRNSFAAKVSLLYAGLLLVFPLPVKYLGPACFDVVEMIKSSPSAYALSVRDSSIIILAILIHIIFLIAFLPLVSLLFGVACLRMREPKLGLQKGTGVT